MRRGRSAHLRRRHVVIAAVVVMLVGVVLLLRARPHVRVRAVMRLALHPARVLVARMQVLRKNSYLFSSATDRVNNEYWFGQVLTDGSTNGTTFGRFEIPRGAALAQELSQARAGQPE